MNQNPYPANAPATPKGKPYRVTAHRTTSFGALTECFVVGDYRWYWQANVVNWWYHHVGGYGCNTWSKRS